MRQDHKQQRVDQVFYNNRLVDRASFRAFVYNHEGEKLAESYEEYKKLIQSGEWFHDKAGVIVKKSRKVKEKHEEPKVEVEASPEQVADNGGNS